MSTDLASQGRTLPPVRTGDERTLAFDRVTEAVQSGDLESAVETFVHIWNAVLVHIRNGDFE